MATVANITPKESIEQNLAQWCYEVGTNYEEYSKQSVQRFIKYIGKQSVTDLGAGDGAATKEFIKNGNKVTAVDINKDKLKHVDQRADIICNDALSYLKYITLGNVFCHHTIEHIVNYQEVLDTIAKKLQKGKYCYIAVPKGDHIHSVHHVAFDSVDEIIPPGLEVIEKWELDDNSWPEFGVIARKV